TFTQPVSRRLRSKRTTSSQHSGRYPAGRYAPL
ncbi:uncharacterized protein METZ01_LOCUS304192, partial [marine metagenome]